MLKIRSIFLIVNTIVFLCSSLLHASQRDDDKFHAESPSKQSLSSRFSSFVRDTLHRSPQRVVKYEISPDAKFFVDCYNATSLYGDTISLNDLLSFNKNSFVVEKDTRQEVKDHKILPYINIGLITGKDPIRNERFIGTASKISDKHILTAAHNLVDCAPQKRVYTELQYFSAFNKKQYLDEARAKRFFVPKDYCQGGCDIAIVELEKSIEPSTSLAFVPLLKEELRHKPIRVIGYPSDLIRHNPSIPVMFEDTGQVLKIDQFEFSHDANTYEGNSGGPVLLAEDGDKVNTPPILGVHVRGPSEKVENDMNHATMINKKNYDMLNQVLNGEVPAWMEEFIIIKDGDENGKK